MNGFWLGGLPLLRSGRSCSINWENRTGAKGEGCREASALGESRKGSPCIRAISPGETVTLADIQGSGAIQHIWCTVTDHTEKGRFVLRDLILRMYWDGEASPSVECPLGDFFLNGFARGCEVNSLPVTVNPKRGMNSFLPMPFRASALITLENQHMGEVPAFFYQVDYVLTDDMPAEAAYFHAQWRREKITTSAKDFVVLDGVRGRGQYVGTYLGLATLERYWWGEGEMKFYIDGDTQFPSQCSTGTEDYFGGAWSFGGTVDEHGYMKEKTYCTPFMGYPFYSRDDDFHNDYFNRDCPPMRGFYRWHVADPVLFERDLRVELQQIGVCELGLFERRDDVCAVSYWYQTEPHAAFPVLPDARGRWPR